MGRKLDFPESEELFEEDIDVDGIMGACYCCAAQVAFPFNFINNLPYAEIEGDNFFVFLCQDCESDADSLKWEGITDISYDILWLIQEELDDELAKIENKHKRRCTSDERNKTLVQVYKKASERIKDEVSKNYLKLLTKDKKGNS